MSPEPAATDLAGKEKEFRILALSGGGYLGVFTAALLADLEEKVGEPLGRRFDLIAGTSVGGILAVALAFELPMREILGLFLDRGEQVAQRSRIKADWPAPFGDGPQIRWHGGARGTHGIPG